MSSAGYRAVAAPRLTPSALNPTATLACTLWAHRISRRKPSAGSSSGEYINVMYFCSTAHTSDASCSNQQSGTWATRAPRSRASSVTEGICHMEPCLGNLPELKRFHGPSASLRRTGFSMIQSPPRAARARAASHVRCTRMLAMLTAARSAVRKFGRPRMSRPVSRSTRTRG